MKIRKGFVSNSSSSSFICDVCGENSYGYDVGLDEAEMCECENGHTFCTEHFETGMIDILKFWLTKIGESEEEIEKAVNEEDYEDLIYDVPEEFCPICQFKVYSESDMKSYLKKKYNVSEDDAFAEVKKLNGRRKKLYDSEYNFHVCKVRDTTIDKEFDTIKEKYSSYKKFKGDLK